MMKKTMLRIMMLLLVIMVACKKEDSATEDKPVNSPVLEGGTGGKYSVAVFSTYNGNGINSKIFIKYAANKMPTDTEAFDASDSTMVEPGYGPHVHFNGLKKGTYFVYLSAATLSGEKVIEITDSSKLQMDVYAALH